MAENPVSKLNDLYLQFSRGEIDRRHLMLKASGLGLSAVALSRFFRAIPASAQDASPAATYEPFKSITREEWRATLAEAYPFTKDPGAQNTGGTVIYGEIASSNLTTVNQMLANNSPTLPMLSLVFEYLVGSSPIDGQYVPGLADSWEIAEDGKTYTFHLNQQATWHDGTPFTAADVIFSLDAEADPATGTQYQTSFTNAVESYTAIDDHTVQLVAKQVFAQVVFLGNALTPVVAKHIWENVPHDQWATDPGSTGADPSRVVGTGPFKFQGISEAEGTATFVKAETYYDGGPALIDTLIFQVWPDETAAVEALRAGDIDFYEQVPPADIESLQADENIDVAIYDTYSFRWFGYNLDPAKTPLFQDKGVRQALFYGLDRQSMVDNIMLGYAVVAQGSQPTLSVAYNPDAITTKYTYDPEKAKQLLADAGWADADGDGILEKDGTKFSFEIMYGSGSAQLDQSVAYMQDAWKAIGVEAQPNPVDFDTVLVPALVENFDFDMCFLGFNWDVTADQSAMFGTEYKGAGFNAMSYSNPEFDKLAAAANIELDPEKRKDLLTQAANIVNEDLPVGIIWFRRDGTAYRTRLNNYTANGTGILWSMPWVWVSA